MTLMLFIIWILSLSDENNPTVLCVVIFITMLVSCSSNTVAA